MIINTFRRAKTTQNVSIPWVTAERLKVGINKLANSRGVFVGNFTYKSEGLELGDLGGNHFAIALRNILPEAKETIGKALEALQANGFVNYFGLQRFGTVAAVKTSDIGLALIKGRWEEAVELLLRPRPNEDCQVARGRAFWWMYRDAKETLKYIDASMHHAALERFLLQGENCNKINKTCLNGKNCSDTRCIGVKV